MEKERFSNSVDLMVERDNEVFEYLSKMTARPDDMSYDEYVEMRKLWKSIYKQFKKGFLFHHSTTGLFDRAGVMISKTKGITYYKQK